MRHFHLVKNKCLAFASWWYRAGVGFPQHSSHQWPVAERADFWSRKKGTPTRISVKNDSYAYVYILSKDNSYLRFRNPVPVLIYRQCGPCHDMIPYIIHFETKKQEFVFPQSLFKICAHA